MPTYPFQPGLAEQRVYQPINCLRHVIALQKSKIETSAAVVRIFWLTPLHMYSIIYTNSVLVRQMLDTYSFFPLGLDCQIQALTDEVVNPRDWCGV